METKTRMNVRTRKAIEREMKKEKKKYINEMAKKVLKNAIITIVIFAVLLSIYLVSEVIRFNKALGTPPGIVKDEEFSEDSVKYTGVFKLYTITYKYPKTFLEYTSMEDLENVEISSGEFKLLDKKIISAWIK